MNLKLVVRRLVTATAILAASAAYASSGEVFGSGLAESKIRSCERARIDAKGLAAVAAMTQPGKSPVRMTWYSPCDCAEDASAPVMSRWSCSVSARWSNDPG